MRWLLGVFVLMAVNGCDAAAERVSRDGAGNPQRPAVEEPASSELRVVMLGDSLTAGYGLSAAEAFPALVESELQERGWDVRVINAGVSGDTTAGGIARVGWLLEQDPALLVVGLGANDGLRGLAVAEVEENLRAIVDAGRESGSRVLLLGMRVPPNYGDDYASSFDAVYPRVAADLEVGLMPFLLQSVGGRAELNQADGIHPNAEGHQVIAHDLLPFLEAELSQVARPRQEDAA